MRAVRWKRSWLLLGVVVALSGGVGCSGGASDSPSDGAGGSGAKDPGKAPPMGATDFVSADAVAGEQAGSVDGAERNANASAAAGAAAPGLSADSAQNADPRTVAEGDIYRVLDNGTLLNLNSYRGLQVIDISDPAAPAIVGRVAVLGTPLEMYVRGDRAYVLLNDWEGYYGTREDVSVERREGGLLAVIDLSDRSAPRQISSELIRGYIRTSRLVANDSTAALYVASSWSGEQDNAQGVREWIERTVVTSFDVASDQLSKQSELDLGGYVQDIQATPDRLLVASSDWGNGVSPSHTVALVDISDPRGQMVQGAAVPVQGMVQSQFNMDLYNGVLRVVSTSNFGNSSNAVETFDARDIQNVTRLDSCAFGSNQQLYATVFLENKAFFVTYFRQDPFHAFSIGDDGQCQEQNEFIVSGWNDFLRPVAGGTRLVGVGTDDAADSRTPSVSLYDITDLSNRNPLLSRASAGALDWSWSEANSDHRAFSVLENAVSVSASNGSEETGLVLLPFSGYKSSADGKQGEYFTRVQIFTFSDHTVTRRGTMDHDSPVRRSFPAREGVTANLSENTLALHDPSNPDQPRALGQVELAPDYSRVLRFGDYVARLKRPSYDYYDAQQGDVVPQARVDLLPAASDMNGGEPVASLEVPADARLLKAGNLLVSVAYRYTGDENYSVDPPPYHTTVQIFDLSDPTKPRARGKAEADDLQPVSFGHGGYYAGRGGYNGFAMCGNGAFWFDGAQVDGVIAIGDALVFTSTKMQDKVLGQEHRCSWGARWDQRCDGGVCEDALQGSRECSWLNGKAERCTSQLAVCDLTADGQDCTPVEFDDVEGQLEKHCYDNERHRYWTSYSFKALDLSDPAAPKFGAAITMPKAEEAVSILPAGKSLYYSFKLPTELDGDDRPVVRYFFKEIDFSQPGEPALSAAVNVPGELISVAGDMLYTKDLRWGETSAETYVHELERAGNVAALQASHRFAERQVSKVVAEGSRLYVTHAPIQRWSWYHENTLDEDEQRTKLTLLAANGLEISSEVDVDVYSSFEAVHADRALFTVPGGLMIINVEDAAQPRAQAFFNTPGWPEQILFEDGEVLIAAGQYGIHRFASDQWNLLDL